MKEDNKQLVTVAKWLIGLIIAILCYGAALQWNIRVNKDYKAELLRQLNEQRIQIIKRDSVARIIERRELDSLRMGIQAVYLRMNKIDFISNQIRLQNEKLEKINANTIPVSALPDL